MWSSLDANQQLALFLCRDIKTCRHAETEAQSLCDSGQPTYSYIHYSAILIVQIQQPSQTPIICTECVYKHQLEKCPAWIVQWHMQWNMESDKCIHSCGSRTQTQKHSHVRISTLIWCNASPQVCVWSGVWSTQLCHSNHTSRFTAIFSISDEQTP